MSSGIGVIAYIVEIGYIRIDIVFICFYRNRYWPASAPTTTRIIAVYLLVNLYNADKVNMYSTAANELSEIFFNRSSTEGLVMNPGKLTLASNKSAATIATTPTTAPQTPSKNAASVYRINFI